MGIMNLSTDSIILDSDEDVKIENKYAASDEESKTDGDKKFYNLKYIEKVVNSIGSLTHENEARGAESTNDTLTTNYNIRDLYSFVKKYDENFGINERKKTVMNLYTSCN